MVKTQMKISLFSSEYQLQDLYMYHSIQISNTNLCSAAILKPKDAPNYRLHQIFWSTEHICQPKTPKKSGPKVYLSYYQINFNHPSILRKVNYFLIKF